MFRIVEMLVLHSSATLAAGAAFTCTGTYCPNYQNVKAIMVDGTDTNACGLAGFLTDDQLTTINRDITITFNQPAFLMDSSYSSAPASDTYLTQMCGVGTSVSCPAETFTINPGRLLSSISTRNRAMTSNTGSMTAANSVTGKAGTGFWETIGPTISFNMDAGKYYSFLMIDCFSKSPMWTPFGSKGAKHYEVLNMQGNGTTPSASQTNTLKYNYAAPGLSLAVNGLPNVYTFQVWESTSPLTAASWTNAVTTMQTYLTSLGLTNAQNVVTAGSKLVALNYMFVKGTVYTRANICRTAATVPAYSSFCIGTASTCHQNYSSSDLMCLASATTPTPSSQTSSSEMTSAVKFVTGIILAMAMVGTFA